MKNKFKLIIVAIVILVLIFFVVFRNDSSDSNTLNNLSELIVKSIQDNVKLINQEENYETKTLNNEDFLGYMTDGGAQLVGYFKDDEIYKIVERLGLSYGVMTYEYYLLDGQLIMIHEIEEAFPYIDDTGTFDYKELELTFDGYYYIDNEKLVDLQIIGKKKFSTDIMVDEAISSLILATKQNIELLNIINN